MSEGLMIKEMHVSNFMRLKLVDVVLSPGLNLVTGRNGQGKSSFIKAIEACLGGERHAPEQPIRRGQKQSEIVLDLGHLQVIREWDAKGKSSTILRDENGEKLGRPAEQIKALIGELTFDPVAFLEMEPKRQAEILRKLTGLSFDDLNVEHARLFQERAAVNKSVAQADGQLAGLTLHEGVPTEEVSVQGLAAQLNSAHAVKSANDKKRQTAIDAENAYQRADDAVASADEEIERLEKLLADAQVYAENARAELREALRVKQECKRIAEALVDPDTTAIQEQIAQAETTNRKVRSNADRAKVATRLDGLKKESRGLTKQLEAIEAKKTARLEAAQEKMPVPGLAIEGDEILLNSVPLSQASGGEGLTLCCEIGAALNPTFRTMLIHGGERLDKDARTRLAEWSINRGIQVVMEMRTDGEPGWEGVQLEDGEVASHAMAGAEA